MYSQMFTCTYLYNPHQDLNGISAVAMLNMTGMWIYHIDCIMSQITGAAIDLIMVALIAI